MEIFRKIVLFSLVLGFSSAASATGFVVPGYQRTELDSYTTYAVNDTIGLIATAGNSYYCRAIPPTGLDVVLFNTTFATFPGSGSPTLTMRGNADGGSQERAAFAFIANNAGSHTVTVNQVGIGSLRRAIFTCHNTTLFGNFNTVTAANPVNFLEVKNISNVAVTATVTLRGFNGTQITSFPVVLQPNTRQDIAVHDIGGAANTFGSVQIAHNGSLGALVANVSKYKFDGVNLDITATESLAPRVEN